MITDMKDKKNVNFLPFHSGYRGTFPVLFMKAQINIGQKIIINHKIKML